MRAWTLASRPAGLPNFSNFAMVEIPDAQLGADEFRVKNGWLSVDPYMRGRMNDVKSYVPPFQIGETLDGAAVGRVVESRAGGFGLQLFQFGQHTLAALEQTLAIGCQADLARSAVEQAQAELCAHRLVDAQLLQGFEHVEPAGIDVGHAGHHEHHVPWRAGFDGG